MRSSTLRHYVRAILNEDYRVTISGIPIEGPDKRKRGEQPPESIVTNIVLKKSDLDDIISVSNEKDLLRPSEEPPDMSPEEAERQEEIDRRIKIIEARVDGACAKLAKMLIKTAQPGTLKNVLFNMPDDTGTVKISHPDSDNGFVYDIPNLFNQLADYSKPGARGKAIGKGEALAILMFGRDNDDEPEPDLIVGGLDFDVKYFENASSTVETGASLNSSNDIIELIELTEKFWNMADAQNLVPKTGKLVSRKRIRTILNALRESSNSGVSLDEIERCGELWDTVSLSAYKTLSLLGASTKKFYALKPENMLTGAIDFSKTTPIIKIASPAAANEKVS